MEMNITNRAEEKNKRLELTNDYVFKKIFSKPENNLELKELLEAILNIQIEKVEVKNPDLGYKKEQKELTDRIEVHYIGLKKFLKKNPGISSKLEQWLWLIIGEEGKVKMASKKNKTIEKVVKDLDEMSLDENERLEAYKRKLAVWDYNMNIIEATKKGKEEGIEEGKIEIAKKLKEKGLNAQEIEEITGLSNKEIEKL